VTTDILKPRVDLLREEYVLVQAWKKTASYIRYHNWFSDTLELDRTAINLPAFVAELAERLQSPEQWENDPLRIVPAPKSQRWGVSPDSGDWEPRDKGMTAARLRPLAHVSLKDQVVAAALMLCLADRVETKQGDPRTPIRDAASRNQIISYGNRLFCDAVGDELRHRWGSAKLYRAYYQDYRTFLSRPEVVAESIELANRRRGIIVHSDLRQFYDRVRPNRLTAALRTIQHDEDDPHFFELTERVLDWEWHSRDEREVAIYAEQAELHDFSRVALPQGLVPAGFFANVALLDFDDRLRRSFNNEIATGVQLKDACRYVDDLRVVVTVEGVKALTQVADEVSDWLQNLLEEAVPGLELSKEKTKAAEFGSGERPLVRQSSKMNRIQSAVSGGFDAIGGEEILDSIQGLIRSQQALSQESDDSGWAFSPLPDVRDETVTRFAAGRFRKTYRSIRPLLEEGPVENTPVATGGMELQTGHFRPHRTQRELDEDARAFALSLIERWVEDPSNVRLLRIGLDLWPDVEILKAVLKLLRPFTERGGRRKAPRRVAWYCLSEILRAGATETGLVEDDECLPKRVNLAPYRAALRDEAARLIALPAPTIPWYLRQQALLFLAAHDPSSAPVFRAGRSAETKHYRDLIRFLRGEGNQLKSSDFATLAVLSRRAFLDKDTATQLTQQGLTPARQREIAERDPSFARELIHANVLLFDGLPARLREDLCLDTVANKEDFRTLSEIVMMDGPTGPFRNELALLRFAAAFLRRFQKETNEIEVIAPGQVRLKLSVRSGIADTTELEVVSSRAAPASSIYLPPAWCAQNDRWRFQLGYLLRFILAGRPDFTRSVRPSHWKEGVAVYRAAESHWYQRLYGLFNGQPAFGDDWLPITDWMEEFLSALLCWPGCREPVRFNCVTGGIEATLAQVQGRIVELEQKRGDSTSVLMLPLIAARPTERQGSRPLRACVVQTAIPAAEQFNEKDLTLISSLTRKRHRNHLSASLAAVERMLALRETHNESEGRLDWLILPELAVHPLDVVTHLIPFARAHRTIVLAGLTYQEIFPGQPLVNSALWIIPEWTNNNGLQIRIRRQGKLHLAPNEESFNNGGSRRLQGFRPCQWLIGYSWSSDASLRPVWLTASVCYDATDLGLAADLRHESDILAIPALNKDVRTFDQMALALHYHMFQLVIVANNGQYGGSNAYWPSSDIHKRQIFHLHGQPQASIAFLEIEDIATFLERRNNPGAGAPVWKYPPAGMG
jgi:hypothetical protein